jgi:paraquat-inducible protein B
MKEDNGPQVPVPVPVTVNAPKPVLGKPNVMSPIWLLPIVAVLLGLYLMYQSIAQAGIEIRVHFSNASGIVAGKTLVKYQGLIIGKVKTIVLDDELKGVYVTASIDNKAEKVLRRQTQFWLVTPKATIAGISGLDALVTGNYIDLYPGDGPFSVEFKAVETPPNNLPEEGLIVHLRTNKLASIRPGSEVFYKKIPVGKVHNFALDKPNDNIIIDVVIDDKYRDLVKDTSRFWNVSGINAAFGLDGIKVQTESLSAIISGALAFDSPHSGESAEYNHEYTLYDDVSSAKRAIQIQFKLTNVSDIKVGNRIYHNGQKVGKITQLNTQSPATATADIDPRIEDLLRSNTTFWVEKATISVTESKNISNLITGNFILFTPGSGQPTKEFELISNSADLIPGETMQIAANDANGLMIGNNIYFKNYPIGHISKVTFNQKNNLIDLGIKIYQDYTHLVTPKSRFINMSGVSINADVSGLNIQSKPLSALISGGIELVTDPDFKAKKNLKQFRLYSSTSLAKLGKQAFEADKLITLISAPSHILSRGAPVYYRKLAVGSVADFNLAPDNEHILITVNIGSQYAHLIGEDSVFWDVSGINISGSLSHLKVNTESLMTIAAGGINFDNIEQTNNSKRTQQTKSVTKKSRKPPVKNYTLFRSFAAATDNRAVIKLAFKSAAGINIGTEIRHKGIKVGELSSIQLKVEEGFVEAVAKLEDDYASNFARQGSQYWIEKVEVGLSGIKNVDTLISGSYINVTKGDGAPLSRFSVLSSAPMIPSQDAGLSITLISERLMSLQIGSPVTFRQIDVGTITHTELSKMSDKVLITLNVKPQYQHLVHNDSQFWAVSGFNVDIGLTGATLKAESVKSILVGGIAFATPLPNAYTTQAEPFSQFNLAQEVNTRWLEWDTQLPQPK